MTERVRGVRRAREFEESDQMRVDGKGMLVKKWMNRVKTNRVQKMTKNQNKIIKLSSKGQGYGYAKFRE